ncbi:MAG: OsmC family protein [Gemmatimonadaceae bacterium]|nr:OsmC family protein [Gemmatimonadaceae bacterium]
MAEATQGKPPSRVSVRWDGEQRFDASVAGKRETIRIDGTRDAGPSPVDTLLSALAACTGVDVVEILAKRRTPVEGMSIAVTGDRANAVPSRVTKIHLEFRIRGEGIERVHAERAIDLAITKYCSVRDSIDPATPIEWALVLE